MIICREVKVDMDRKIAVVLAVRLLRWSDGGEKADWVGLSQSVKGQDIESMSRQFCG